MRVRPAAGLAQLERMIGLLRVRGHLIRSIDARLGTAETTVVLRGTGLHGHDPDALVVRRLRRLPDVTSVETGDR